MVKSQSFIKSILRYKELIINDKLRAENNEIIWSNNKVNFEVEYHANENPLKILKNSISWSNNEKKTLHLTSLKKKKFSF